MSNSVLQEAANALDAWSEETRTGLAAFVTRLETMCEELEKDASDTAEDARVPAQDEAAHAEEIALLKAAVAQMEAQSSGLSAELKQYQEQVQERDAEIGALRAELSATRAQPPSAATEPPTLIEDGLHDVTPTPTPPGHKQRLGTLLVDAGVISGEQLSVALIEQSIDTHQRLGAILVARGYTSEEAVARMLASQLDLEYIDLEEQTPSGDAITRVSRHLAELHGALPIRMHKGNLVVAMANPLDLIAIEDIEIAGKCDVETLVATPDAIKRAIARHYV